MKRIIASVLFGFIAGLYVPRESVTRAVVASLPAQVATAAPVRAATPAPTPWVPRVRSLDKPAPTVPPAYRSLP